MATLPWQGGAAQLMAALLQKDAAPLEPCVVGHEPQQAALRYALVSDSELKS